MGGGGGEGREENRVREEEDVKVKKEGQLEEKDKGGGRGIKEVINERSGRMQEVQRLKVTPSHAAKERGMRRRMDGENEEGKLMHAAGTGGWGGGGRGAGGDDPSEAGSPPVG